MAFDVTLPQIPAGMFANPSRNIFPETSINAPAGAALANTQNQGRVNQVLDILRQQNEMAGPLNRESFRYEALSEALPEVRQLLQERGAEPFVGINPILEEFIGMGIPTGILQARSDDALVRGQEADVLKTLSEAAENNASAAAAGRGSTPGEASITIETGTYDANNQFQTVGKVSGTPSEFRRAIEAGLITVDPKTMQQLGMGGLAGTSTPSASDILEGSLTGGQGGLSFGSTPAPTTASDQTPNTGSNPSQNAGVRDIWAEGNTVKEQMTTQEGNIMVEYTTPNGEARYRLVGPDGSTLVDASVAEVDGMMNE